MRYSDIEFPKETYQTIMKKQISKEIKPALPPQSSATFMK